jgi:hypothetical protein
MLRNILVLLIYFISLTAQANEESQTSNYIYKGQIELGGGFNLSSNQNNLSLYVNPTFGYLITDKVSIGGSVSYSSASGAKDSFGLSPMIKYYFYNQERIAGFVGQEIGIAWRGGGSYTAGDNISWRSVFFE